MTLTEFRVVIHGASGSGKTTLARALAQATGMAHLELDSLFHQPNWTNLDNETFATLVSEFVDAPRWVIDGNYRAVRPVVWNRANLIVVIDRPRWQTTWRVFRRTIARGFTRQELWNGNRESLRNLISIEPERNIVLWSITRQRQYHSALQSEAQELAPGVPVVTIRNDEAARQLIQFLNGTESSADLVMVDDYVQSRSRFTSRRRR